MSDITCWKIDTALAVTTGEMTIRVDVPESEMDDARAYLKGRHRNACVHLHTLAPVEGSVMSSGAAPE